MDPPAARSCWSLTGDDYADPTHYQRRIELDERVRERAQEVIPTTPEVAVSPAPLMSTVGELGAAATKSGVGGAGYPQRSTVLISFASTLGEQCFPA
jgi:hypothetical protein